MTGPPAIRRGTPEARWLLAATVLGSSLAFLDSTVVNIALPTIGERFHAGTTGLQWTIDAYLVTLTALLLIGGSLGDRFGRRRIFELGLVAFTVASMICGAAPTIGVLIGARALQGVGGALLVPGSLAIISASFHPDDRAWAVGAWSGLAGVSTAIAPFLGGWLIDSVTWRAVFFINLPLAALALVISRRWVPETRDLEETGALDWLGAVLVSVALGAFAYALIESGSGVGPGQVVVGCIGFVGLIAFVVVEARTANPMLPLDIFRSAQFTGANLTTLAVYAGLSGATFLLVLQLQYVLGYSALEAGAALLPLSVLLLLLSAQAGALSQRIGPRLPMTLGPLVAAAGLAWFAGVDVHSRYLADVFPPAVVFGLGLALTVSPLTATVLAAVEDRRVGVASGVNNAVARGAGLLAVAFLPALVHLDTGAAPAVFSSAYREAVLVCAGLCALGGVVAWATIRRITPGPSMTVPDLAGPCAPTTDELGDASVRSAAAELPPNSVARLRGSTMQSTTNPNTSPVDDVPAGERRAILWAMGVAVAITVLYWVLWYAARGAVASNTSTAYYEFENAFPLADAWLCVCLVLAGWAIVRRSGAAMLWLGAAGGTAIYLFGMDVLYDVEQQVWWHSGAGGWIELAINVLTLTLGAVLLTWTWRRRQIFGGWASALPSGGLRTGE